MWGLRRRLRMLGIKKYWELEKIDIMRVKYFCKNQKYMTPSLECDNNIKRVVNLPRNKIKAPGDRVISGGGISELHQKRKNVYS